MASRVTQRKVMENFDEHFTDLPLRLTPVISSDDLGLYSCMSRHMSQTSNIRFKVAGMELGKILPGYIRDSGNNRFKVNGWINPPVISGLGRPDNADEIYFHLFNYAEIFGNPVRRANSRGSISARLSFPTNEFDIVVDCLVDVMRTSQKISYFSCKYVQFWLK